MSKSKYRVSTCCAGKYAQGPPHIRTAVENLIGKRSMSLANIKKVVTVSQLLRPTALLFSEHSCAQVDHTIYENC